MDDSLCMCCGQTGGNLAADAQRVRAKGSGDALDARGERLSFKVLHHDIGCTVGKLTVVEAADDAWMGDDVDGSCFVKKARHNRLIFRVNRAQDFDGNPSANGLMYGFVHATHAAVTNLADDFVIPDYLADHAAPSVGR